VSATRNLRLLDAARDTIPLTQWGDFHNMLLGWVADEVADDEWARGIAYAIERITGADRDPAVTVWAEATGGAS